MIDYEHIPDTEHACCEAVRHARAHVQFFLHKAKGWVTLVSVLMLSEIVNLLQYRARSCSARQACIALNARLEATFH